MITVIWPDDSWHPRASEKATDALRAIERIVRATGIPRSWEARISAFEPTNSRDEPNYKIGVGFDGAFVGQLIDGRTLVVLGRERSIDMVSSTVRCCARKALDEAMRQAAESVPREGPTET